MQVDESGRPILDHPVSFVAVVHALLSLAKPGNGLGGLTYAMQIEHDVRRQKLRSEAAKQLLSIQVRAWRAHRYQPPDWTRGEEWFKNQQWLTTPVRENFY